MPVNKNALLRYATIDRCLSNRQRRWTLQDLMEKCSQALGGEPDEPLLVSRRTIQNDLEMMRSGKLGYEAPIEVVEKKYYRYADPNFSISRVPLNPKDLSKLWEAVELLQQFSGFEHLGDIGGIVERLEARLRASTHRHRQKYSVIALDNTPRSAGGHWIPKLTAWLQEGHLLKVEYKSFHNQKSTTILLHGYLLKEYDQRWYLIGYEQIRRKIMNLPLDRIRHIRSEGAERFIPNTSFDPEVYYRDTIGVTVYPNINPVEIWLALNPELAPYLLTKPLHHSQKTVAELPDGTVVVSLFVRINYELKRAIMSCGPGCMVLKPVKFAQQMAAVFREAADQYADADRKGRLWKAINQKLGEG